MSKTSGYVELATHLSPLIGREDEVIEIVEILANPNCRLLTLTGLGGVGKTRLAVQVASQIGQNYADGTYLIPLQPVSSAEFLPAAIANSLAYALAGQDEPAIQLLRYLQNKEMLLVLDNFEHLTDGIGLVGELLAAAPDLHLLITTRESLKLQQEWVWRVHGLAFPPSSTSHPREQLGLFGALRLFAARARQINPDFDLAKEQAEIVRICQLVEGMPLALELAASWVSSLTCRAIAVEIARSLDFLTSDLHDVPLRHRSVQAVFDQSYHRLALQDRDVFQQLTVFRGGFSFDAAQQVAGASPRVLAMFVDKSLLYKEPTGRYQIHELLRQYSEEKLHNSAKERSVQQRHCNYFARYLHARNVAMNGGGGGGQVETAQEIGDELENIRCAWQWAADHEGIQQLQEMGDTLYLFYQSQSRYIEGVAAFEKATKCLHALESEHGQCVRAEHLVHLGWLFIRLGQLDKAYESLTSSEQLYSQLAISPPMTGMGTDPRLPLATCALIRGDYLRAKALADAVEQISLARGDRGNLMIAFYVQASAHLALGNYVAAQENASKSCALAQRATNEWFAAYCLIAMGDVAHALGEDEQARHHYQASLLLKEKFQDQEGMGLACSRLGDIAYQKGEYREALRYFQSGLAFYQHLGDKGGLAGVLCGLGNACFGLGQHQLAARYFRQALVDAVGSGSLTLILTILANSVDVIRHHTQDAATIYAFILHHPACPQEVRRQIERNPVLNSLVQRANDARASGTLHAHSLESLVAMLDARLSSIYQGESAHASPDVPHVDALTVRELEILHLLALGLSNRQIAQELVLALGTIKAHVHRISTKLDAHNRTEAVAIARERHLI